MKKVLFSLVLIGAMAPALYLEGSYLHAKYEGSDALASFEMRRPHEARLALLGGMAAMAVGGLLFLVRLSHEEYPSPH